MSWWGSLAAQLALNRTPKQRERVEQPAIPSEQVQPWDVVNFQPTSWWGNRIVATSQQPAITRTPAPPVEQPTQEFPTYNQEFLSWLDRTGMQDYIDNLNLKTQYWYTPTPEEIANAQKIGRQLAQPEQPEIVNQVQQELERVQALREREEQRVAQQAEQQFQTQEDLIRSEAKRLRGEEERMGRQAIETQMRILGADAFSSRASREVGRIQETVNENMRILNRREELEVQRAMAERNGASSEALNQYDELISWLREASTKMNIQIAESINAMNQEAMADYQEKIQNIMQVGMQMPEVPLTEEEQVFADSWADMVLDNEWNVVVGMMDKVPPKLLGSVMMRAAQKRGAIAQTQPTEPWATIKVWDTAFQRNPETQRYDIPVWDGVEQPLTALEQAKLDYQLLQNEELKNEIAWQPLEWVTDPVERATIIAAQRWNLNEATWEISIPQWTRGNQCGEFVNDSLWDRVFWDSFKQKLSKANSQMPVVWWAVIMDRWNQYWHVALIKDVDMENRTISVIHSNYWSTWQVTEDTFSLDNPEIAGFYAPEWKTAIEPISDIEIAQFNNPTFKPQDIEDPQQEERYKQYLRERKRVFSDKDADISQIMRYSMWGKPLSDTEWLRIEKFDNVINQLDAIEEQVSDINTWPIVWRLKQMNPYDTDAQVLKAQLQGLIPNLARWVYWEVGVLTDADIRNYAQTIPNLTQTEDVRDAILAMTLDIVAWGYKRQLQNLARSNNDVSGYIGAYEQIKSLSDNLKTRIWGLSEQEQPEKDNAYDDLFSDLG